MRHTRREFIAVTSSAVALWSAGGLAGGTPPEAARNGDDPAMLLGDPYLATVDDSGLGGRSFDDALHRALRFRSTDADRDRYVLGLEI